MPTGPLHVRWTNRIENADIVQSVEDCRCMIGEDHESDGSVDADAFYGSADDDDLDGQPLSVHDAANIWMSNGMDEDYTFGYSVDELRRAAGEY